MKKVFNIIANVGTIVIMSIMLIGAIVLIGSFSELSEITGGVGTNLVLMITVLLIIFSIGTIIVASLALAKSNYGKARGLQIAVAVLIGIVAILEFIGGGYVYGVLCLIPLGFEIASMCVKNAPAPTQTQEQPQNAANAQQKPQTVDEKIAELKHLKEINAITDEQYESAINSIINDAK